MEVPMKSHPDHAGDTDRVPFARPEISAEAQRQGDAAAAAGGVAWTGGAGAAAARAGALGRNGERGTLRGPGWRMSPPPGALAPAGRAVQPPGGAARA